MHGRGGMELESARSDHHGGSGGNMTLPADDMATKFCFVLWQVLEESIAQVDISFVGGASGCMGRHTAC